MSAPKFLDKMETFQVNILEILDNDANIDEKFQNLIKSFEVDKIYNNKHEIRLLLHLLSRLSTDHNRQNNFFDKIERIILHFKDEICKYFLNSEIFNIFKRSKRILLFLYEQKILIFDKYIIQNFIGSKFHRKKYDEFFWPEIKPFKEEKWFSKYYITPMKEYPEDFEAHRKIGENESVICDLIRKDSIEEFIIHINKTNCPLDALINISIYETNSFLLKNRNTTLIEYAAFFGSIQIFNYLKINGSTLNLSLLLYAIHGKNYEIINYLVEEIHFNLNDKKNLKQSIKCHHNDLTDFILNNCDDISIPTSIKSLKYYNFAFIQAQHINKDLFYELCKYDYHLFVKELIESNDIDINAFSTRGMKNYYKTPFYIAIEKENYEIIKLLLNNEHLDVNLPYKHETEIKRGLRNEFYMNEIPPINLAFLKGNIDIIKILLTSSKIDINKSAKYFKYYVGYPKEYYEQQIKCCKTEEVREKYRKYLEWQFNGDWRRVAESTPLCTAVYNEDVESIKLLLSQEKLDINKIYKQWNYSTYTENTAFYRAVEIGNVEIINLLLTNSKIDVNIPFKSIYSWLDYQKGTVTDQVKLPLHVAVEKGNVDVIKILLKNKNVDKNAKDFYGKLPIDFTQNIEIKQLLNVYI